MQETKKKLLFFHLVIVAIFFCLGKTKNLLSMDHNQPEHKKFKFLRKIDLDPDVWPESVIVISKSGNYIATTKQETITIFDIKNIKQQKIVTPWGPKITFNNNHDLLAWATYKKIGVFDPDNKQEQFSYKYKGDGVSRCIAFSNDRRFVAWATSDYLKVFDIKKNKKIFSYFFGSQQFIFKITFNTDGSYLAGESYRNITIFDIKKNKIKQNEAPYIKLQRISAMVSKLSNTELFHAILSRKIDVTNDAIFYHNDNPCRYFTSTAIFMDKNYLVTLNRDNIKYDCRCAKTWTQKIKIFNIKTKEEIFHFNIKDCFPRFFIFSNFASNLYCFGTKEVEICNMQTQEKLLSYRHKDIVLDSCFTNDHKKFISVDTSGNVQIFETSQEYQKTQREYEFKEDDLKDRIEYLKENNCIPFGFSIALYNRKISCFKALLASS